MLGSTHLPIELFTIIVDFATDGKNDHKVLCNFSLVSRQWRAALNPRIYSRWSHDGFRHSILSLWQFLRSTLSNRQIADSVREINIRNWTFGLVYDRGRVVLDADDLDLIRDAISTLGLQRIETRILEAVLKADPRPFMALLLANLRNLMTLYAQLPETDIFLDEVLQNAIQTRSDQIHNGHPRPLYALREAHLTSAWNYRKIWHAEDVYKLELHHLWPVFRLPNIQVLSVFDFEPLGASNILENCMKLSNISELTLVHHYNTFLAATDMMTLLTLPKRLTKLSIYLNDCDLLECSKQLSNADLWNGIRQYEDCIEHLDIYRDCSGLAGPHSANSSCFGNMKRLRRLKSLHVQVEVLLGGCCGDKMAPYELKDTLPLTLKSLILYGHEGLRNNKSLGQQVQDVIRSTDFPHLSYLALETPMEGFSLIEEFSSQEGLSPLEEPANPPHEEVERACRARGIKYETRSSSSCIKGGIGRRYYRNTLEKRSNNKKVEPLRYALNAYLGGSSYTDSGDSFSDISGDDPDDKPKLSLEDLDTYELPWDKLTEAYLFPEEEKFESVVEYDEDSSSEDEDLEGLLYTEESESQSINADEKQYLKSERDIREYDSSSDGVW